MIQITECCICNKMSKVNLILGGANICKRCEAGLIGEGIDRKNYIVYKDGIKRALYGIYKNS